MSKRIMIAVTAICVAVTMTACEKKGRGTGYHVPDYEEPFVYEETEGEMTLVFDEVDSRYDSEEAVDESVESETSEESITEEETVNTTEEVDDMSKPMFDVSISEYSTEGEVMPVVSEYTLEYMRNETVEYDLSFNYAVNDDTGIRLNITDIEVNHEKADFKAEYAEENCKVHVVLANDVYYGDSCYTLTVTAEYIRESGESAGTGNIIFTTVW